VERHDPFQFADKPAVPTLTTLRGCMGCHSSIPQTLVSLQAPATDPETLPNRMLSSEVSFEAEAERTIAWKKRQESWSALMEFWSRP
jgi:hypothetical protein